MSKIKADKILQNIKAKEKKEIKVNMTIRIPKDLLESFRKRCDRSGVSSNSVIEELMRGFLGK